MRKFPAGAYVRALAPHVPPQLISHQSLSAIEAVADRLPGAATGLLGLECPLDVEEPLADFSLGISTERQEREVLAEWATGAGQDPSLRTTPAWRPVLEFCTAWADPASVLHHPVGNVWLEFDVAPGPAAAPAPSAFFGSRQMGIRPGAAPHEWEWITSIALPTLLGHPLSEAATGTLGNAIRFLPEKATLFQFGVMCARTPASVRACVMRPPRDQLAEYLGRLGWPGSPGELDALIGELAPFVDRVNIDLDIPGSLSPKLGVECSLFPKHSPDSPRRWRALLDYAVRRGLCMPSKADALLRFPGEATESSDAARWPESLRQLSRLMGARYLSVLTRGLHHLKIVYKAGAPLRAKAYLSVRHSWVPAIRRSTETEG